jgi:hypothetical protein
MNKYHKSKKVVDNKEWPLGLPNSPSHSVGFEEKSVFLILSLYISQYGLELTYIDFKRNIMKSKNITIVTKHKNTL